MIYVSSSCVKNELIKESIAELRSNGIDHIELSGGTKPYSELESDLIQAKEDGAELLVHNYFPPPEKPFVLNLASVNSDTRTASLNHCKRAIDLSRKLGAKKFAFHAGFFLDISVNDIGKKLTPDNLVDEEKAYDLFCAAHQELTDYACGDVKLYVENNVLSAENHQTFYGQDPLMFVDVESYNRLASMIDFNLLLDVAHLKVSCNSLGLNFSEQLKHLYGLTDYIHISDNDGTSDSNQTIDAENNLWSCLSELDGWAEKTITLEVYSGIADVKDSIKLVTDLTNA